MNDSPTDDDLNDEVDVIMEQVFGCADDMPGSEDIDVLTDINDNDMDTDHTS